MSDDKDDDGITRIEPDDIVNFVRADYVYIKLLNRSTFLGKVNIQKIDELTFLMVYDPIEVGYEVDPDFEEPMMYFMNPLFATKQDVMPVLMEEIEFFGELNDTYYEMYVQQTGIEMDMSVMDKTEDEDDTPKEPTKKKSNVFYLGKKK